MECMERAFIELLQTKEMNQIHVTDICKQAGLNRTTFYASYVDIYDLADSIRNRLEGALSGLYQREMEAENYLRLFQHMKANRVFYKTYFKLGYDNRCQIFSCGNGREDAGPDQNHSPDFLERYQMEFFRSGVIRIMKMWLYNGCRESTEEMAELVKSIKENLDYTKK